MVSIEVYRSQRVVVMGEVRNAGTYPLSGAMNVLEALVLAGSPTADAGHEVLIVRSRTPAPGARPPASGVALDAHGQPIENASTSIVRIDLLQLQQGLATDNIMLQDGDTIFVPRAEMFFVFGHVRSPGAYALRRGMTVVQALALAGGVTDRGATNRIRVIRHEKEIRVGLDDLVEARDTIRVPERYF
jgi:polysaccharide export outer membrane protein